MKKIAWLKYTGSLELGLHLVFTQGSQDLRTRLVKEIIDEGVEIHFYSKFSKESLAYLQSPQAKEYFGSMSKIILHDSDEEISKDVDFLIVESGSDNIMFEDTYKGQKMPAVAITNNKIKKFKGLVFYLQIDLALKFVYFPEFLSVKYINEHIHTASYKDLFKDKKWIVLMPIRKNCVEPHKHFKTARCGYDMLVENNLLNIERFEFHYCGIDFSEELKIKTKTPKTLCYIGGERNRIQKFTELYSNSNNKSVVWGRWTDKTKERFNNVDFKGTLGKGLTKQEYNKHFGSVIIGDKNYEKLGCVSGRFFEVVTARTLPLIDKDLVDTTISDIFDKNLISQLVVSSGKQVQLKMDKLHNSNERIDLIKECCRNMRRFNPNQSFIYLSELFNKYKNKPKKTDLDSLNQLFNSIIMNRVEKNEGELDGMTKYIIENYE